MQTEILRDVHFSTGLTETRIWWSSLSQSYFLAKDDMLDHAHPFRATARKRVNQDKKHSS